MPALANPQWEIYAQERSKGNFQKEAFIAAGFKYDRGNASRLDTDPLVQARIAELMAVAAEDAGVTRERIVRELAKIGFSDVRKLYTDNGTVRRMEDIDDDTAGALAGVEVVQRRVAGGDENETEYVHKVKLWDKPAALVNLGKHLGMFKEKVELSGPEGGPIEITNRQVARKIAFALSRGLKAD